MARPKSIFTGVFKIIAGRSVGWIILRAPVRPASKLGPGSHTNASNTSALIVAIFFENRDSLIYYKIWMVYIEFNYNL
jgi:hypothetical protein